MNLNSSHSSQEYELRQAVEEQLDLILKMEEERKALKRQNKLLHHKLNESNRCIEKYHRETVSIETNTQNVNHNITKIEPQTKDTGVQIDIDPVNTSSLSCSKLQQAQSLLKVLDVYESRCQTNQNGEQENKKQQAYKRQKSQSIQKQKQKQKISRSNHQIASQMVKLTKELNAAKKELKDMDHKYKLRDKEIKDLKKCIETKNQALEKSRKDFNELSNLMNSDKYKSVRVLEQQLHNLKAKYVSEGDPIKMKNILAQLTQEYDGYRKEAERKIDILVAELANKEKEIELIKGELKNSVLREL